MASLTAQPKHPYLIFISSPGGRRRFSGRLDRSPMRDFGTG